MRKLIFFLILLPAFSITATAQAYEDNIQYDKKKQAAIAVEYSFPPEALENAFIERMRKLGYKPKEEKGFLNKDKGFLVFKDAYVTDISKDKLDYIVNVEKKSRKEEDAAVLFMFMMKKEENVIATMGNDNLNKVKKFLNNLLPEVEAAYLELQIRDQEESLTNAEKKLRSLQGERLELDRKLAENLKTQDEKTKEIESHKLSIETLKAKRKKD